MKIRTIHTVVVFLLSLVSSALCVYALDEILIEPPLTWSIDSVQVSWTISQDDIATTKYANLYETDPESNYSPLTPFGLYGKDVSAFAYEDGFNYNQTDPKADPTQWSESEKEVVSQALTDAFESNDQKTTSNQRLVFTVKFINHTISNLKFDHRYTNSIPIYIGETAIGKAAPVGIDKVIISIPPTGEPVSVMFEAQIDEKCKSALLNNKPVLKFSEGQLFFRIPVDEPQIKGNIYKKSIVDKEHFTVAVQVDSEVKEWNINWIDKNPVTLQEALKAINDYIRREYLNDDISIFDIKDNHLVSVCDSPFTDKDAPDWLTELKVFKDGAFQAVADPDSCLSQTPRSGERYVFQLIYQDFKKLVAKANAGDAKALNELGDRYFYGDGVPEDMVKAVELFRKSAEKDNAKGQYNLGCCYFYGDGVEEDKHEAFKWIRKAGEAGHADAQCNLGFYYYNGEYVEKDKAEAIKWWKKAASQGIVEAQYYLGLCYIFGDGVEKDAEAAIEWFRMGAQQDDAKSCNALGVCYSKGDGVEMDMKEAVAWFRKAAEKGFEAAYNNLGICYEDGKGVEKDMKEAVSWYQKAAEKDYPEAQFNLGDCYYNGEGVAEDKTEAVKWYRKAAEAGVKEAQYSLGNCYKSGEGVSKDVKEAARWYQKAADQGFEDAVKSLKELNETDK